MVDTTVFGDLPSYKFDKKFQEDIDYKKLENFEKKKTEQHELNNWIGKFKNELEKYFNVEYKSWTTDLRQKRCRDLDYWVLKVQGKMSDLLLADQRLSNCISSFRNYIQSIFQKKKEFECERYKDTDANIEIRKKLDDYCENRDYIKGKIDEKKNKDFCEIYNTYNRENDELFNNESSTCKKEYMQPKHCIIHKTCTIQDRSATFPQIDCAMYDASYESDNNSLLNKLLLTILLILGIGALFLFLYKYTPLSSFLLSDKLRRKKNNIFTEDTQEISEDNTEYSPQYTENVTSNIGYNMI
ncbi:PIR Superfamily Protein [Plasmodium ovale wallikeri]|uniref:PIR Superfamily Protein n=1 Tax=Plasmodium ovale wallikeri TaxID=864142 RepID=A0A1A9AMY2_PLAOA|nr:PIR Superfamily Protein [Plasmodium ovale wallikeri]SBT59484.1 PIR Superfamily Protein [Plasmodium ovale wallikeri]